MGYRVIAFDLDGTLLDGEWKLSEYTKHSINRLSELGYLCVFISSRIIFDIKRIASGVNIHHISGLNGALDYEFKSGKISVNSYIEQPVLKSLFFLFRRLNITTVFFSVSNCYTTKYSINRFIYSYQREIEADIITNRVLNSILISIQTISGNFKETNYLKNYLLNKFGQKLSVEECGFNFLHINKSGINKGTALKNIVEKYGYTQEEVIAIGDSYSDLPMLNYASLGVGMCNGTPDFLEKVDMVTDQDCYNGGAINFLNKILSL